MENLACIHQTLFIISSCNFQDCAQHMFSVLCCLGLSTQDVESDYNMGSVVMACPWSELSRQVNLQVDPESCNESGCFLFLGQLTLVIFSPEANKNLVAVLCNCKNLILLSKWFHFLQYFAVQFDKLKGIWLFWVEATYILLDGNLRVHPMDYFLSENKMGEKMCVFLLDAENKEQKFAPSRLQWSEHLQNSRCPEGLYIRLHTLCDSSPWGLSQNSDRYTAARTPS